MKLPPKVVENFLADLARFRNKKLAITIHTAGLIERMRQAACGQTEKEIRAEFERLAEEFMRGTD